MGWPISSSFRFSIWCNSLRLFFPKTLNPFRGRPAMEGVRLIYLCLSGLDLDDDMKIDGGNDFGDDDFEIIE